MKHSIDRFLIIGDSLSDKGTMADSILAPMSGLVGNSPEGRFTNGFAWIDFFCQKVMVDSMAQISDQSSSESSESKPMFVHNDDKRVATHSSQSYVRTYCEGGMSAHNYFKKITLNPLVLGSRMAVANLDEMRDRIKEDDKSMDIPASYKQSTLVIEWSGANDLITVNEQPSRAAAELAVKARVKNIEKMIGMGYQHFVLFNLPDLSLTPRFQKQPAHKQQRAQNSVDHCNEMLGAKIAELTKKYPQCSISIYDANQLFKQAFNHPEQFGLEEHKKNHAFIESEDFKNTSNQAAANGYMFWDDVHPAQTVHSHLANDFYEASFMQSYNFLSPNDSLLEQFQTCYGERLAGRLGFFRQSNIDYKNADLQTILKHALHEKGYRTRDVIVELGWVDRDKRLSSAHPLLGQAIKGMADLKADILFPLEKDEVQLELAVAQATLKNP